MAQNAKEAELSGSEGSPLSGSAGAGPHALSSVAAMFFEEMRSISGGLAAPSSPHSFPPLDAQSEAATHPGPDELLRWYALHRAPPALK